VLLLKSFCIHCGMYGIEELDPLVMQHFSIATFGDKPLSWLYKILGAQVVEDTYKGFFRNRPSYSNDTLLIYLNASLNPLLNEKLNRPIEWPTFRDMLEHCYAPLILADPKISDKLKREYLSRLERNKNRRISRMSY